MSEIKVVFGALEAARVDVASTTARIAGRLADLERYLAPLVGTWEGQAATEYRAKQQQWDNAATDLVAVLERIGVALGSAGESYRQAEDFNTRRWRGPV